MRMRCLLLKSGQRVCSKRAAAKSWAFGCKEASALNTAKGGTLSVLGKDSGRETQMNYEYEKAVEYVLQIPRFTKKNTPEATRSFYEYLGCPGERARIIHVAGTNGKGSVCSYINAVLIRAGIRTALFTSPHLVDIRERIRVDGKMVSRQEFAHTLNRCLEELERFRQTEGNGEYHPTFF